MSDLFDSWVYETNADNTARFVLGEKGDNPLVCIGVNPSTATPEKLDPTLRRVKKFSETLGFDGWIMLNLYPQRATDPDGLHEKRNRDIQAYNEHYVGKVLLDYPGTVIWAAWGALISKREYLIECLRQLVTYSIYHRKWITLGETTKDGHPRHPLYLPGNAKMQEFNVNEYLKNSKAKVNK